MSWQRLQALRRATRCSDATARLVLLRRRLQIFRELRQEHGIQFFDTAEVGHGQPRSLSKCAPQPSPSCGRVPLTCSTNRTTSIRVTAAEPARSGSGTCWRWSRTRGGLPDRCIPCLASEHRSTAPCRASPRLKPSPVPRQAVLGTKFLPQLARWTQRSLRRALAASNARLGVAASDIYFIHTPVHPMPLEHWVAAAAREANRGRCKALGLSNCNAEQVWA